jgi:hypothetical protein
VLGLGLGAGVKSVELTHNPSQGWVGSELLLQLLLLLLPNGNASSAAAAAADVVVVARLRPK